MSRARLPQVLMEFARTVSRLSTCQRLQVGAVVASLDHESVLAFGYNGNVVGGPNTCDTADAGACGCVHAEINALLKAGGVGRVMLITDTPCLACAKAMLNAHVVMAYFWRPYRDAAGFELLKDRITTHWIGDV
jgi:deoxycytidylate deaminase